MTAPTLRIGTRASALALWQANEVARLLGAHGHQTELVHIRTTGDKRQDVSLAQIGGKGVFIKELEEALTRGEIDLAVHSLKDVPSIMPAAFELVAFLQRADPRDVWIGRHSAPIESLPDGSVVGTSAPRRRAQLKARYPHLQFQEMRGNVDSRVAKVEAGQYAGAVLASAGLTRLGRTSEITQFFSTEEMLPAAGQGIVTVQTVRESTLAPSLIDALNDESSALAARCERGVLQRFGTLLDCYSAVAVFCEQSGDELLLRAFVANDAGDRAVRAEKRGTLADSERVVDAVFDELVARGARELLEQKEPNT
jgi:hydroxymethylbilane synthase